MLMDAEFEYKIKRQEKVGNTLQYLPGGHALNLALVRVIALQ